MQQFFLFLFFFICSISVNAQHYISNVTHYDQEDGLSHNQVRWMFKDQQGMMWIGAINGINRFDGQDFKLVEEMSFFNAPNYLVFEDKEHDLWLKEDEKGLTFFNTINQSRKSFEEKFGDKIPFDQSKFNDAVLLRNGDIVIGTIDGRLILFNQSGNFVTPFQEEGNYISPLGQTADGRLWIEMCYDGLTDSSNCKFILLDKKGQLLKEVAFEGESRFYKMNIDEDGSLLCHNLDGVIKRVLTSGEIEPFEYAEVSDLLLGSRCFKKDTLNNRSWFAKEGTVVVYDEEERALFQFSAHKEIARGEDFHLSMLDDDQYFWISSIFGVLKFEFKINPFQQVLSDEEEPLLDQGFFSCRGITSDESGNIFINALERTHQLNPQKEIAVLDSLSPKFGLYYDKNGYLWTMGKYSVIRINTKTKEKKFYQSPKENANIYIWSFYMDVNERLWLASEIGIYYIEKNSEKLEPFDQYNDFDPSLFREVYSIEKDRQSRIWLTTSTGLFRLDLEKGITERYWSGGDLEYYLPAKEFKDIYQDENDLFWIASSKGLIRWEKTTGEHRLFTTKDGLSHNNIYAVYEDNFGFLWMSSDNGIIQFEKSSYLTKRYRLSDGITHQEFNRISHYQAEDGTLYFGSLNGVTYFHPRDFYKEFDEQPEVSLVLTECQLFSGERNQLEDRMTAFREHQLLTMKREDRYLNLEFALLDYSGSNEIQYAYQIVLDGQKTTEDWNYGKENSIKIGTLPYGRHQVIVKGRMANGLFSKNILSIPVLVLKPFYLQWWFVALFILSLILIGFLIAKTRTKLLLLRQKELEAIVTERTQTISIQAEKLKALNNTRSKFIANISHEFRTPLTLILNTLHNNELQKLKELKEEVVFSKMEVEIMERNAKRLNQLIGQLLDLSKLESGKIELQTSGGDFKQYLADLVTSFSPIADQKEIELTFSTDQQDYQHYFDRDKMDKVFYNLVSNALKFTKVSGAINLDLTRNGEKVEIKITDTGIGIPKDQLDQVFNRFYRVKQSDEFAYEGTGIGLALVKELIEVHQGTIHVESKLNKGTHFIITLPLKIYTPIYEPENERNLLAQNLISQEQEEETSTIELNEESSESPILLIIEDNEDLRYHLQKTFETDHQILLAKDGKEGFSMAEENIPDLIICDVMMPVKNGYEVCRHLKLDEKTNHIPIILLTAKAAQEDRLEGLMVGADDYITKPYHPKELRLKVQNLLQQSKRFQNLLSTSSLGQSVELLKTPQHAFLQKVHETIEAHIADGFFGVEQLSEFIGLSRSQLFRKTKAISGKTPVKLIQSIRLQKAKKMLKEGAGNATEVAYKVGFNNPNYFFKCFKKEFGLTAGEWIRQHTQKEEA